MKKIFVAFAACALLASCGSKPATEEQVAEVAEEAVEVVEEVAEAPAVEAVEDEKATLIDLYVKACEDENEVEATRVAKRIDAEYKDQLTSADIERMTNASAVLAAKRAEQAKAVAAEAKEEGAKAVEALKGLKK